MESSGKHQLLMELISKDLKDNNNQEAEVALVEKAYFYFTKKTYPASCTKNDKHQRFGNEYHVTGLLVASKRFQSRHPRFIVGCL